MSGLTNCSDGKANEDTLKKNLAAAIPLLEKAKVVGLIEPINSYSVPGYFLNSFELGKYRLNLKRRFMQETLNLASYKETKYLGHLKINRGQIDMRHHSQLEIFHGVKEL